MQRRKSTDVNSSALTQPFVGDNSQTAIPLQIHPGGVSRYLSTVTPPVEPEAIAPDKADVEAEAQQEQVQQTISPAQEVASEPQSQQASAPADNPSDALGEQVKVASANTKETLIKSNQDSIPFQKFTQQTLTLKDQEQTDLVDKSRKDADAAVAKSRQDGDVVADGRSVGYKPGIEYLLKQGGSPYYDTIITMTKNASQEERRSVSGDPKMRELIVKHLSPPQATAVMAAVMQGEQRWQESGGYASEFMLLFLDSKQENPPSINNKTKMNCWEMILYTAYLLGQISYQQFKKFLSMSKNGNEKQIWTWLGWQEERLTFYKGYGTGREEETMPQPGQLLFFRPKEKIFFGLGGEKYRDYPAHVAISLGGDDAMSLWNKPNNINYIQRIKVKDIFKDKDNGIVQIGRPITTVINSQKSSWKE